MIYSSTDIEELADEIIRLLDGDEIEKPLAIPALCMALAKLGDEHDLDAACRWIDEFREEQNE